MSKLFKLKSWMTLKDAAEHLTVVLTEQVEEKDLWQMAIEGHLTLSFLMTTPTPAKVGKLVSTDDARLFVAPSLRGSPSPEAIEAWESFPRSGTRQQQDDYLQAHPEIITDQKEFVIEFLGKRVDSETVAEWTSDDVTFVSGVWDLPDDRGAPLYVRSTFEKSLGLDSTEMLDLDGAYLINPVDGSICLPQIAFEDSDGKHGGYMPDNDLPEGAITVIRPQNLNALLAKISEDDENQEMKQVTRESWSKVMRAMAELASAGQKIERHKLVSAVAVKAHLDNRQVRNILEASRVITKEKK